MWQNCPGQIPYLCSEEEYNRWPFNGDWKATALLVDTWFGTGVIDMTDDVDDEEGEMTDDVDDEDSVFERDQLRARRGFVISEAQLCTILDNWMMDSDDDATVEAPIDEDPHPNATIDNLAFDELRRLERLPPNHPEAISFRV